MEFEQSLTRRNLAVDLQEPLLSSSPRWNPDSCLSMEDFTLQVESFHPQAFDNRLLTAIENNNEPIFTLGDVTTQLEQPFDITNDIEMEHSMEMDKMGM
ncbi:hypothetical protein [Aliivibrio finisterrensis]|uniref:Uncharacterized protein n=1 Tax=Aliivibrio finisterrensis TaxID=511998 RepID=A0ABY0I683_9GAMM|nr:hypothetical protein [Aliivibrio finisterrensis]RYU63829.1 hypothetical protein ERW53_12380 [Aliivibrio finisterrensis]RYU82766.1 hypothetical protein ERW52_14205 [Aliivibrio finisterrensis]